MNKDNTYLNTIKNNLLFHEEKNIKGANISPDKINKNYKRAKSTTKIKLKMGISQLPRVNENLNFGAHEELNEILKKETDKIKRLEKLPKNI